MATKFFIGEENPLKYVTKNKDIVKHLQRNKIDGFEINKILFHSHGLKIELPIKLPKHAMETRRQLNYVVRWYRSLINSPVIIDDDKEILIRMYNDYLELQNVLWKKGKTGNPVVKIGIGEEKGHAKSTKQMLGLRVVNLYEYLEKHNRQQSRDQIPYKQKEIFNLMIELFEIVGVKLTFNQIKNFYKNNL